MPFPPGAVRWRRSAGQNADFPALFMHLGNLTTSEPVLMLKAALGKQRANCETRMARHRPG